MSVETVVEENNTKGFSFLEKLILRTVIICCKLLNNLMHKKKLTCCFYIYQYEPTEKEKGPSLTLVDTDGNKE